ncbi:MAG: hypothetical protein ACT4NY_33865, partial [Pseudonocardiales bacterium]
LTPARRRMSGVVASLTAMPSLLHETLVEMFRHRPSLAVELLAGVLGVDVPGYERVRVDPGECTDLTPTEYRADTVVVLLSAAGRPVLAVVVEVQLGRDGDKRWSWPVYLATLRARLRCPAVLLVVCVDAATASWCASPIELGHPGLRLVPLVLGPDRVPVVTEVADAVRAPELAVLSAMAHGGRPEGSWVLNALLGALEAVDEQRATLYSDVVLAALPVAARRYLEALMISRTHEYQSEFVRRYVFQGRTEGRTEGRAEGEATALLTVLHARGIDVPEDARTRIIECSDLEQLDAWVRRAVTAGSVDDLFS